MSALVGKTIACPWCNTAVDIIESTSNYAGAELADHTLPPIAAVSTKRPIRVSFGQMRCPLAFAPIEHIPFENGEPEIVK